MVTRAIGPAGPVWYASWSWDRVAVDPVPGPRGRSAFVALRPVGRWNAAVTSASRPRQPESLLLRLAGALGVEVFLLDAERGGVGLHRQLRELVGLVGLRASWSSISAGTSWPADRSRAW